MNNKDIYEVVFSYLFFFLTVFYREKKKLEVEEY